MISHDDTIDNLGRAEARIKEAIAAVSTAQIGFLYNLELDGAQKELEGALTKVISSRLGTIQSSLSVDGDTRDY